jgi:hypothetical protein
MGAQSCSIGGPSVLRIFQRDSRFEDVRRINIYLLRVVYALMFVILGKSVWTHIFTHQGQWEPDNAIAWCVWAAFATLAGIGIIRPLKMVPILLLEVLYKVLWLFLVAYPLWSTDRLTGSPAEGTTSAFLWVLLPIVVIPWPWVFRSYIVGRTQN